MEKIKMKGTAKFGGLGELKNKGRQRWLGQ